MRGFFGCTFIVGQCYRPLTVMLSEDFLLLTEDIMQTVSAKTILQKGGGSDWFGCDYNMNLYRGCCHGCIYCDSRSDCYHVEDFDTVRVKENCIELLRNELRRKVRSGVIGTGAMSDPYNPFEREECITQKALMLIDAYNFGSVMITKSALIARDVDIYADIAEHSPVLCLMTITAADDKLCGMIEPNVSRSSERFEALAKLSERGIFTGITMTPVLPFIEDNEDNILRIVRTAKECGVRAVYPMFGVTLRANQRDYFYTRLNELFPGMSDRYRNYYGERYGCTSPNAKRLYQRFAEECEKLGILYKMQDIVSSYKMGYGDMQLSFF